jgi:hypothetical protein
MDKIARGFLALAFCVTCAVPALAKFKCGADSVQVGNVCVDLYEASVWQIDPTNKSLLKKIQSGKVTLADLTVGGATQLSANPGCTPAFPVGFPSTGNWTPISGSSPPSPGVYAVSIPGVPPTGCITWFQANQACLLSGKHLITNREWQGAAAGTPDPGTDNGTTDCAVNSANAVNTGSRSNCKSSWGVFDMVGNVEEWVADWADLAYTACTDWTTAAGLPGGDTSCYGGDASAPVPGALVRGGRNNSVTSAGVFAVDAGHVPTFQGSPSIGFRCAR